MKQTLNNEGNYHKLWKYCKNISKCPHDLLKGLNLSPDIVNSPYFVLDPSPIENKASSSYAEFKLLKAISANYGVWVVYFAFDTPLTAQVITDQSESNYCLN